MQATTTDSASMSRPFHVRQLGRRGLRASRVPVMDQTQAPGEEVAPEAATKNKTRSRGRRRFWLGRVLPLACLVVVAGYLLIGFLVVPWAVERYALPYVERTYLNGSVSLNELRVNPLLLRVEAAGVTLADEQGQAVASVQRFVGDASWSTLWRFHPVLDEVIVEQPHVDAVVDPEGTLNLTQILKEQPETTSSGPVSIPRVAGGLLRLSGGSASFTDQRLKPPYHREVGNLGLAVDDFDLTANGDNTFEAQAATDRGGAVRASGVARWEPLGLSGRLDIDGLDIAALLPYINRYTDYVVGVGKTSLELTYDVVPAASDAKAEFELIELTLGGIELDLPDQELAGFESLAVRGVAADAVDHTAKLEAVEVEGVYGNLIRAEDGSFVGLAELQQTLQNLRDALDERGGAADPQPAEAQPAFDPSTLPPPVANAYTAVQQILGRATEPWAATVGTVRVSGSGSWTDRTLDPAVVYPLEAFTLAAGPTTSAEGFPTPYELTTQLPGGGQATVSGRVRPLERTAGLQLRAEGLDAVPLAGYLKASNPDVTLNRGRFTAEVDAALSYTPDAPAEPRGAMHNPLPLELAVGRLAVGGSLEATDASVDPPAVLRVDGLDLKVGGLDTAAGTPADVSAQLRVNQSADISARGTVLPNLAEPVRSTVDLTGRVEGLPLQPFDGYAKQLGGFQFARGAAFVDLTLKLTDTIIEADVPVEVADLEFAGARGLALTLPLRLLKDPSDGRLKIGLRVPRSDITDPSFNIIEILLNGIASVFTNAARTPFALLGNLVPGGENLDLSRIDFDTAEGILTPAPTQKLDQLAEALKKKPQLQVTLVPKVTQADRVALQRQAFRRGLEQAGEAADFDSYRQAVLLTYARVVDERPADAGPLVVEAPAEPDQPNADSVAQAVLPPAGAELLGAADTQGTAAGNADSGRRVETRTAAGDEVPVVIDADAETLPIGDATPEAGSDAAADAADAAEDLAEAAVDDVEVRPSVQVSRGVRRVYRRGRGMSRVQKVTPVQAEEQEAAAVARAEAKPAPTLQRDGDGQVVEMSPADPQPRSGDASETAALEPSSEEGARPTSQEAPSAAADATSPPEPARAGADANADPTGGYATAPDSNHRYGPELLRSVCGYEHQERRALRTHCTHRRSPQPAHGYLGARHAARQPVEYRSARQR